LGVVGDQAVAGGAFQVHALAAEVKSPAPGQRGGDCGDYTGHDQYHSCGNESVPLGAARICCSALPGAACRLIGGMRPRVRIGRGPRCAG
jgi:hypothetical protein